MSVIMQSFIKSNRCKYRRTAVSYTHLDVYKRQFMGSLTVLADGMPFSGGGAHLHLDCNDMGIPSVHKVPGMFLPTGVINPIPPARQTPGARPSPRNSNSRRGFSWR